MRGGGCCRSGSWSRCRCWSRCRSGSDRSSSWSSSCRSELCERLARITDYHHVGEAWDFITIREEAGEDSTFDLGFLIKRCLVSLIAEKDIANSHLVTYLLLEFGNDAAFY